MPPSTNSSTVPSIEHYQWTLAIAFQVGYVSEFQLIRIGRLSSRTGQFPSMHVVSLILYFTLLPRFWQVRKPCVFTFLWKSPTVCFRIISIISRMNRTFQICRHNERSLHSKLLTSLQRELYTRYGMRVLLWQLTEKRIRIDSGIQTIRVSQNGLVLRY